MSIQIPARFRDDVTSVVAAVAVVIAASSVAGSSQDAYFAENTTAMDKMMAEMVIKPSGDIDRDFATMMIPHHQGAIDMAQSELRYGRDEQVRRIAQGIIVEQQQEITAMRLVLDQPLHTSAEPQTEGSSNVAPAASMPVHHHAN